MENNSGDDKERKPRVVELLNRGPEKKETERDREKDEGEADDLRSSDRS